MNEKQKKELMKLCSIGEILSQIGIGILSLKSIELVIHVINIALQIDETSLKESVGDSDYYNQYNILKYVSYNIL